MPDPDSFTPSKTAPGNPFDVPDVAARYEDWYGGAGRSADRLEKGLLAKLLAGFPAAQTALEIGCGTGHFSRWLSDRGFQVTGLDCSQAMLAEARRRNGLTYVAGDALDLPYPDGAFDLALLITTLEFVADPVRALREAVRIARQGVILGVLNRWSLLALKRRWSGKRPWSAARFFGPQELAGLVRAAAGSRFRQSRWRTTLFPLGWPTDLSLPWGGFIGLAAFLTE